MAEDRLRDGDLIALHAKQNVVLKRLEAGERISLHLGTIDCDAIIGHPPGVRVWTHLDKPLTVLRPSLADFILNMKRKSGIVYPKELGMLLMWADIRAGMRVLTAGAGSGALTLALLSAVGPTGRVYSYDVREDMLALTRANAATFFGKAPSTLHLRIGDVAEAIAERHLDRILLDLPDPEATLPEMAEAIQPGGLLAVYVPSVTQVERFVNELRAFPEFQQLDTFETLLRFWHVNPPSVRPKHEGVRHTGFVTLARRIVDREST